MTIWALNHSLWIQRQILFLDSWETWLKELNASEKMKRKYLLDFCQDIDRFSTSYYD